MSLFAGDPRDTRVEPSSTTSRRERAARLSLRPLCLVVLGEGLDATHPLPADGVVTIGRSEDADIRIDHASVSRRHAAITLGSAPAIEDLGSSNGTRAGDDLLVPGTPAPIAIGEPIDVGSVMVVVQQRAAPVAQRHVWAHGYFEARLTEECARADTAGGRFAVMRVHGRADTALEGAITRELRAMDVIGYHGPGAYEVLILDGDPAIVAAISDRLRAAFADRGLPLDIGVARYPDDGRDASALLRAASAAAAGEPAAVGADAIRVVSPAMEHLDRIVQRVAAGSISVLISGETGVGKEVLAGRLHRLSPRAERPFLGLNCAALSESLLESELFGHERGAFTGAIGAKPGLLETAEGGTVFLDEIGELPMSIQVKLLRVLEERKVFRVGGLAPRPIDVRFLAATNRDLEAEIARGGFRQDLYFRLNGVALTIPPLRQRVSEIAPLARAFLRDAAERNGTGPIGLSYDTIALLEAYDWPGNIRELRNMMERAALLCADAMVQPEHLPVDRLQRAAAIAPEPVPAAPQVEETDRPPDSPERQRILDALIAAGGNQTEAARRLGMSRRTLINRMVELGLPRPRKKAAAST
jgi:two-component system, NtrC family, response regulator AtoC